MQSKSTCTYSWGLLIWLCSFSCKENELIPGLLDSSFSIQQLSFRLLSRSRPKTNGRSSCFICYFMIFIFSTFIGFGNFIYSRLSFVTVAGCKDWRHSMVKIVSWIWVKVALWLCIFDSEHQSFWQSFWIQSEYNSIFGLFGQNYFCEGGWTSIRTSKLHSSAS